VFDLDKDFHIVYGKNNIGKSYAISLVYLILKSFREGDMSVLHLEHIKQTDGYQKILMKGKNAKSNQFSVTKEFEKLLIELFSGIEGSFVSVLSTELENSFDLNNVHNKFAKRQAGFNLTINGIEFKFRITKGKLLLKRIVGTAFSLSLSVDKDNRIVRAESSQETIEYELGLRTKDILEEGLAFILKDVVKHDKMLDFSHDLEEHYTELYFLPASRSGLYEGMNIFSSLLVQLSQSRRALTQKVEIPSLPIPTSDYLLNLSTIKKHKPSGIYAEFAQKIEQKILKAEVVFNNDNKKLEYYNKEINLKLDIGETSSMISEVAPIVAHLKYIISKEEVGNKILFIEEPEAHLHPEVQLALIEVFAELTQHNIKIVMTTHSNYIFNKVNNLLLNDTILPTKIGVHHLLQTKDGSIQNPDIFSEDTGMIDENFVTIAEQLYNERLEITD
jgi:predicted ATPase